MIWLDKCVKYQDYPIILGPGALREHTRDEILKRINVHNRKIILLNKGSHYKVTSLLVPSIEHFSLKGKYYNGASWYGGFFRPETLNEFRRFWSKGDICGTRKFFIKRPSNDRLVNENEVADFFQKNGFEVVNPGVYDYGEQVSIFQNAKWIVACHGAALSNIVHCPHNAIVVQLTTEALLQNLDFNNIGYCVGARVMNVLGRLISSNGTWTAPGIKFHINLSECNRILDVLKNMDNSNFSK